jgi:hypothetical protein
MPRQDAQIIESFFIGCLKADTPRHKIEMSR